MQSKISCFFGLLFGLSSIVFSDTIDHYMNIANGIPQMEMKADSESQTWARSARTVLTLTCDGIADTLMLANETSKNKASLFFVLLMAHKSVPKC